MFSRSIKQLRHNTAIMLTLRFATLFLLSAAILFVTVDYLLGKSRLEQDQQLINSFLESYQRLEAQAGLHKLELVVQRDAPFLQRSDMRVAITDARGKSILVVQPAAWQGRFQAATDRADAPWRQAILSASNTAVLFREARLSDGVSLSIGKSEAPRSTQLASDRRLVIQVMLPLLLLGLLLTAYMNWRALRPVHDLIDTVRSIQANHLKARVEIRSPDSELGELAQLFNDMLAQIERLIGGMRHSLDSVAHDLRTPLARMRLSLEAALTGSGEQQLKEALLDCAEESERIEAMLRTLMDLSEAESGILTLHPSRLDLTQLIEECLELYSYVAEEKAITLAFEGEPGHAVTGDPMRLRQVLANLLDNAIKYTPHGGRVSVRVERRDRQLLISVTDTGIGIAPPDQPLVFDRLFRADSSRGAPGMGLGLSLVKAVVEAHGGNISLDSRPGAGCRFDVALPASA